MSKTTLSGIIVLASLLCAGGPASAQSGQANKFRRVSRHVPNRYFVVLDQEYAPLFTSVVAQRAAEMSEAYHGRVLRVFDQVLGGFGIEMTEEDAIRLSAHPFVRWVEEDGEVNGASVQTEAPWGLDRIDDRWLPLDGTFGWSISGVGANVYLLDSGVRTTHSEFGGRVIAAYNAVNDTGGTSPCFDHGTHTAGIVAGNSTGVAKGARVYSVRVLNCPGQSSTWLDFVEGVQWITANHVHPAVVIANVTGSANTSADEAVLTSIDHNLLYVLPAGNDGADACANSPARVGPALTVGATGRTDQVYFASNQGTCVDIFAPGEDIPGPSSSDDTTITSSWGTSEAAPHVAGVAATYLAANPAATNIEVMNAIVGASTPNVISGLAVGSPNRLLFSDFVTCPTGRALCSGRCADLDTEKSNCGSCGAICTGTCSGGICTPAPVCPSGTRDCCHDGVCRPYAVCSRIEC